MKHDFSIQEIVGALKKARGLQNYYTDAQLAHLFDMGREINDVLHYLPERDLFQAHSITSDKITATGPLETSIVEQWPDDWQECDANDLEGNDQFKITGHGWEVTKEAPVWPVDTSVLCVHPRTGKYIRLAEVDGSEELTLYRIPAPVVHPDPKLWKFIVDNVTGSVLQATPGRTSYISNLGIEWSPSNFKDWSPAHVVAGDDRG